MRATFCVVYCTHCHTTIRCFIRGLESMSSSCKGCNAEYCDVFSVDEAIGQLCPDCNWCWEDCYGIV